MSPLRQQMQNEMVLRGFAASTAQIPECVEGIWLNGLCDVFLASNVAQIVCIPKIAFRRYASKLPGFVEPEYFLNNFSTSDTSYTPPGRVGNIHCVGKQTFYAPQRDGALCGCNGFALELQTQAATVL